MSSQSNWIKYKDFKREILNEILDGNDTKYFILYYRMKDWIKKRGTVYYVPIDIALVIRCKAEMMMEEDYSDSSDDEIARKWGLI